jgi:hypothetical protein
MESEISPSGDLPGGGQESKNHKDRPNHHNKCTLSILIMTNNTGLVAFDGLLMENRGSKRKIVALDPTAKSNPDGLNSLV